MADFPRFLRPGAEARVAGLDRERRLLGVWTSKRLICFRFGGYPLALVSSPRGPLFGCAEGDYAMLP
jgi:hypothetical protein